MTGPDTAPTSDRDIVRNTVSIFVERRRAVLLLSGVAYAAWAATETAAAYLADGLTPAGWPWIVRIQAALAVFVLSEVPFEAFLLGSLAHLAHEQSETRPPSARSCAEAGLRTLVPLSVLTLATRAAILLGGLLFLVPGVVLTLRWFVAAPALAIERNGLRGALSRSAQLTHHRWSTLFVLVTVYVVASAIFYTVPAIIIFIPYVTDTLLFWPLLAVRTGLAVAFWAITTLAVAVTYVEFRRAAAAGTRSAAASG